MLTAASPWLIVLLAALVALGPLSTDMYLPALPTLTTVFGSGVDQVQLTLSVFLVGFALAQLVYGPLSDRYGRKPLLLAGLVLFALASLGCAAAGSIETLIVLRLLQALGGCGGPVLGRAVIRDLYDREKAARMLSYIGTAMALAPAIAPILGGYLLTALGWQAIFVVLALYGFIGAGTVQLTLGETNTRRDPHALQPRRIVGNYSLLLRDRRYLGYALSCSFVYAGLFAFISGSSFVIIDYYGFPAQQFGYLFALVVVGYMSGTLISGRFGSRLGHDRLLLIGAGLCTAAGVAMVLLSVLFMQVATVIGPMVFYMLGVGMVMPQAMAGAIGPFPQMAGVASALLGFLQMSIAAVCGILVGHLHDGTALTMTLAIAAMGAATLLIYISLVWRHLPKPDLAGAAGS